MFQYRIYKHLIFFKKGNLDNGGLPVNPNLKVTGMEITKYPSAEKLVYTVGDSLDLTGLEVSIQYDNGSTRKLGLSEFNANSISINPNPDGNTKVLASTKTVKITHVPTKKTATVTLTVNPIPKVKELMITESPKKEYVNGDNLDLTGMKVLLRFDNETTKTVTFEKTKNSEGNDSDTFRDMGIETSIPNGTKLNLKSPGDKEETKDVSVSFRNSNNTLIKSADPLYLKITPIPRISGVSADGYKFSYIYGDKIDFSGMELTLISSNKDMLPDMFLVYADYKDDSGIKKGFVVKNDSGEYTKADLYNKKTANDDPLRYVEITQTSGTREDVVINGDDVGLGKGDRNIKALKITHYAKDVAPVSTDINIVIKPPSKAFTANISGIQDEFEQGDKFTDEMMDNIRIIITRDSVISSKPGESLNSHLIKVLFKKGIPYEYQGDGDTQVLTPYNKDGKNLKLELYNVNNQLVGELVPDYEWKEGTSYIGVKHTEPIIELDESGIPINIPGYTTLLREFHNVSVKSRYGVEKLKIIKDPTLEGDPNPQSKIFFNEDPLDISELLVEVKLFGDTQSRYLKSINKSNSFEVDLTGIDADLIDLVPYYKKLAVSLELSTGTVKTDLADITLTNDYNGSKIKISMDKMIDPMYSKPLVVKNEIKNVYISNTIAPRAGYSPSYSIPNIGVYPYLRGTTVDWDGFFEDGKFKSGESYSAKFTLDAKPEYTFKSITGTDITVAGASVRDFKYEDKSYSKISFFVDYPALPQVGSTSTQTTAPSTQSLSPTSVTGSTAEVKTADEFYSALQDSSVDDIGVVGNITLTKSATITKDVNVNDGSTLSYYADANVAGRSTDISAQRNKEARQFRITKNATLTVENQATLNKLGTGDITVDNGGKVVAYGTLSTAGKKLIGKQGTALKTYGNSAIVISATSEGQIMTLSGNADLIQSMTLDKSLVVANGARLNVKQGKTLRANSGISITNRGTMYLEDSASIAGSGEFAGTAPVGNSFGGFLGADSDALRYGTKSTALNYRKYNSNINMSFTVPYKTRTVYFSGVNVKAGDLKPGTYTLRGTDGISSVPIVIGAPSVKTGLSRVGLGTNGYVLPATLRSGNYTVNGIIGGLNVTLEINIA